jgi:hypothetical protein
MCRYTFSFIFLVKSFKGLFRDDTSADPPDESRLPWKINARDRLRSIYEFGLYAGTPRIPYHPDNQHLGCGGLLDTQATPEPVSRRIDGSDSHRIDLAAGRVRDWYSDPRSKTYLPCDPGGEDVWSAIEIWAPVNITRDLARVRLVVRDRPFSDGRSADSDAGPERSYQQREQFGGFLFGGAKIQRRS